MQIERVVLGEISVNCYLISTEKSAIIIDPGFRSEKVFDFLKKNKDKKTAVLLTHAHFDHIGMAGEIVDRYNVSVGIGKNDASALQDNYLNLSSFFGVEFKPFSADMLLGDNDEITVGDITVKVFETSGHTVGGVCYLIGDNLFSGDTLFLESYGRTDFPGGNIEKIKESIDRILDENDENVTVYTGHGNPTTIKHEREYNPLRLRKKQ
ncbi:MAG: MBL fold metallo-hydrolase [Clostridia bacterium]|nr:MBL fold metallo-hydrolase [Clostridia bacterium]